MAVAVAPGRLIHTVIPRRRGIVRLDSGEETLLAPIPPKLAEGANVLVEILRDSIAEEGRDKLPKVRVAQAGAKALPGPALYPRIAAHENQHGRAHAGTPDTNAHRECRP